MHYLTRVTLENEMDLVLAHKRSMKLAEIAGLSLAAQTTFATAVSEVARNTIEYGKNGCLTLGVSEDKKRSIIACIKDDNMKTVDYKQGLDYAKRLVDKLNVFTQQEETSIELFYFIPNNETVNLQKLDQWRSIFRNEAPISPYDEIKRKNEQLQELAQRLKESEDHYKDLTDTLPIMMFSLNNEGDLSYVNRWMSDYFGYGMNELQELSGKKLVHQDDRPPTETIKDLIVKKEPVLAEWRIKNKSGDYIWHMVAIHPRNLEDDTTKWYGFLVDIHARKLVEQTLRDNEELKQTQLQLQSNIKELNRSNEELQQFAYVASHDLQEPLRKIIFYTDYIRSMNSATMDVKSTTYLQSMINASMRMRNLVSDLLAFSQVDRQPLHVQQVNLSQTIQKAIATYDMMIREKQAVITWSDLPTLQADEPLLQRLFENLLSNSIKYAKEDQPAMINIEHSVKGDKVELRFIDNGIGFDAAFNSKVFGIFQRLHSKEQYEGTGIGLAICRKIVEMHNGTISAQSDSGGNGATFIIQLPQTQERL
jgi:PAS domain S-box-containing protein